MPRQPPQSPTHAARRIPWASAIYYALVFAVAACLFHVQSTATTYTSEFLAHVDLARDVVAPDPLGFAIPHPGFHWMILAIAAVLPVDLALAGILLLSGFAVVIAWMVNRTLRELVPGVRNPLHVLALGGVLLLVSTIYCPLFSPYFYLGHGSANFWAVPTLVVVKPFALWSVLLLAKLLKGAEDDAHATRLAGWFAVSLLVGVVMKPSFILCFAPVAGLYLLAGWRRLRHGEAPKGLAAFAPSVALMAFQYYTNYYAAGSEILFTWFGVWSSYSPNIAISVLLAHAFPLAFVLFRSSAVRASVHLRIAWAFQAVAFLQFAFVAEREHFSAANFSWGYNLGLWLLFVFTAAEFLRGLLDRPAAAGRERLQQGILAALLGLHLVSGAAYLAKQMLGGTYN